MKGTTKVAFVLLSTSLLSGCEPKDVFWTLVVFFGAALFGGFFLLGWLFQKMRDLGDELAKLLDEWRRSGLVPPPVDPIDFAATGRLKVDKRTVYVQEDDVAYWSFSVSNPDRLEVTITSELFSDGVRVASHDEVITAATRGFAISRTLRWNRTGDVEVKGKTTFAVGGRVMDQVEQAITVTVRGDE